MLAFYWYCNKPITGKGWFYWASMQIATETDALFWPIMQLPWFHSLPTLSFMLLATYAQTSSLHYSLFLLHRPMDPLLSPSIMLGKPKFNEISRLGLTCDMAWPWSSLLKLKWLGWWVDWFSEPSRKWNCVFVCVERQTEAGKPRLIKCFMLMQLPELTIGSSFVCPLSAPALPFVVVYTRCFPWFEQSLGQVVAASYSSPLNSTCCRPCLYNHQGIYYQVQPSRNATSSSAATSVKYCLLPQTCMFKYFF